MDLMSHLPLSSGWQVEITATDLSTRVLAIAEKGIWSITKAREIPYEYLKAFMLRGTGERVHQLKAGRELQAMVRFATVNLNVEPYPFAERFDAIFCRNVLIYFDKQGRDSVVRNLLKYLKPGGYFFLGHAESLQAMGESVSSIIPTVYRLNELQGK